MKRSERLLLELATMSQGEQQYYVGMLAALGLPATERNMLFIVDGMVYLKQRAAKGPPN